MTQTRSDDLIRLMLERRAADVPPAWLLPSVGQAVRVSPQAQPGSRRAWWQPRRRSERLVLVAASAVLLLALVVGALVAGGVITRTPKPPLPADVVVPSPSVSGSADAPSASPSGKVPGPDPGDPISPTAVVGSAWTLPTGWRYELVCDEDSPCRLHLFDASGQEQDGWPVVIPGVCEGSSVAIGPKGSAFLACDRDGRVVVTGLDSGGKPLPGWPVSMKGAVAPSTWNDFGGAFGWAEVAVGPDETVYTAVAPKGRGSYAIHALAPDGSGRPGWPIPLDGDAQGFAVALNGTIVAWWYEGYEEGIQLEARRTVFTEISRDGKVLSGWPKGSVGAASGPVVWEDGSIFYTSASGKVWGHDRRGEIIGGWPHQMAQPVAPALRADGTLIFVGDSQVDVLDRHGKAVHGWPYRTKGSFNAPGCDTGGFSYPLAVAAADGTLYLASSDGAGSSVVALHPDGSIADGWPYHVAAGWGVTDLGWASDGTLEAHVAADGCEGLQNSSIRLTQQGRQTGAALPTAMSQVYKALRLEGLRTTSGQDTFVQATGIGFEAALVNRSSHSLTLPYVEYGDRSWYAAGTLQTWIEPLDHGSLQSCLPDAGRADERYGTGGWITVWEDPVTIQPGGSTPGRFEATLYPQITSCLPPGDYRYRIDYKRLGADEDEDEAIDTATFDFTITARAPGVNPTPSPTPSPTPRPTNPPSRPTPPPPVAPNPTP